MTVKYSTINTKPSKIIQSNEHINDVLAYLFPKSEICSQLQLHFLLHQIRFLEENLN